jgi:ASC-1-like (ASCH) protein
MNFLKAIIYVVVFILILLVAMNLAACSPQPFGDYSGGGVFRLKVGDPQYTELLNGKKTIEARADREPYNKLKEGDEIIVIRARPQGDTSEYAGGPYKYNTKIKSIKKFKGINELLKDHLAATYPSLKMAEAVERFNEFLPEGAVGKGEVLAIELAPHSKTGRGYYPPDNVAEYYP